MALLFSLGSRIIKAEHLQATLKRTFWLTSFLMKAGTAAASGTETIEAGTPNPGRVILILMKL